MKGRVSEGEIAVADIDGDGASDLFVGLPSYGGTPGRVAVWLGGSGPFGPTPTLIWDEPGERSGSFGRAIANAGDVDGDALDDVVVSAPSPGRCVRWIPQEAGGRVFLFRGARGKVLLEPASVVRGDVRVGGFGIAFQGSGDVDGDGYSDVLVRAEGRDGEWCSPSGTEAFRSPPVRPVLYLLRGGPAGFASDGSLQGASGRQRIIGDHDRDGRAEVLPIGKAGALGKSDPLIFVLAVTMPSYSTAFGDVDGDGFVDLVQGYSEYTRGRVLLYRGGKAGLHEPASTRFLAPSVRRPLATADTVQTAFGRSIAVADIDHDGFADVIVGAPAGDKIYVYPGRASLPATIPRQVISAAREGAWFPTGLVPGDFNRDGFGDVAVTDRGKITKDREEGPWLFLYLGSRTGLATTPNAAIRLDDIDR